MTRERPTYVFQLRTPRAAPWHVLAQSVLVHLVLGAIAVRATAIAARELEEAVKERIAYMPPPNRRANSDRVVEHLQYVELGGGVAGVEARVSTDPLRLRVGAGRDFTPGGDVGDRFRTLSSIPVASPDSVYSEVEVEERVLRMPGSAAPVYPVDLLRDRVEGAVLVRFIVDTAGRVEPASIQVLNSSNEEFTASVRTAIPLMYFTAATVSGRRVRQAVEQNFRFRLPAAAAAKPKPA